MRLDQVTYLPLNLPLAETERSLMKREVKDCTTRFFSPYRNCEMIPVYTQGGLESRSGIRESDEALEWTSVSGQMPRLKEFIQKKIFPLLEPRPRVFILMTPPQQEIPEHVDCSRLAFDELQIKLRVVLSGDTNGLWFRSARGGRQFIQGVSPVYVIDGSHAHGMINRSEEPKFTLCFGSPWQGRGNERWDRLVVESQKKFAAYQLIRSDLGRPCDPDLFQEVRDPVSSPAKRAWNSGRDKEGKSKSEL